MIKRDEIRQKFEVEALEHGKAISTGDHKKANKLHKKLTGLYAQAKGANELGVFAEMLDHSEENVRLWAATFSLAYAPEIAEPVLQNLTNLSTITGLTAKTTLHLWKQGMLNLL
ncbi:DUF2019 domain-containing protein [Dyadobacter sp. CY261]|uniref:DUF2019 domain-containing protein n=1 Tax=Dyadobacter sp. CY261 TaxID=2907203 RepID=UPI001F43DA25|nr:DUF2019 domain-containing protein [Dyadobacter sp. CY261]MCF0069750.1 DUF2019 domain-containing protein [Dyadobacter sp. CY261]